MNILELCWLAKNTNPNSDLVDCESIESLCDLNYEVVGLHTKDPYCTWGSEKSSDSFTGAQVNKMAALLASIENEMELT
jgi:hypothetical protein